MKRWLFILIFFTNCASLFAGDGEWAVSRIPSLLLNNAHVVKRFSHNEYEVISYSKARYREKYVLTILDENGDKYASLTAFYDRLRSIRSIDGKLYDQYGIAIKELKNRDIKDYSATSNSELMDDSRVKYHDFHCRDYPYTIEYDIVTEFNNTFLFPPWMPQPAEEYAVENADVSIKCPSWYGFNFKVFNIQEDQPSLSGKDDKTFSWQISNRPAIIGEFAAPNWQFIAPCIYFSAKIFEIGNYKGSMDSWKQMGEFVWSLNKDRDKLPDDVKLKVHQLTDGVTDTKEKIRLLYEYMQKNTRYVSIQLGIGGYQPFDAATVASKSYGDCKALSNFMYSLLKEANIPSCYTLIRAGRGKIFFTSEFPYDCFNHAILFVPLQKDTVWLECTSQTLPAGYLSGFTADRFALAIDADGGHIVKTPKYGVKENLQVRQVAGQLDEEGNLQLTSQTAYQAIQQDYYHEMISHLSKEKIKERLHEQMDLSTYDINDFRYTESRSPLPTLNEELNITVSNYAVLTGKRLFIVPDILNRFDRKLLADNERKYIISLYEEYRDIDTVVITLPAGYVPESIPQDVSISNQFGKYKSSVKISGDKLIYYREMTQFSGEFQPKDYASLVSFFNDVYKADRNKVVFVNKQ